MELQNIADQLNITGYNGKNKSLLIDHIIENANKQEITAALSRDSKFKDEKILWWKRNKIAGLLAIVGLLGALASIYSVIFQPSLIRQILNSFGWIWSGLHWIWNAILASYSMPGWILIILFLFAFVGVIKIYLAFRFHKKSKEEYKSYTGGKSEREYKSYIVDIIYGVKWRWSWKGNEMEISDILCFCLICDAQLVLMNSFDSEYDFIPSGTDIICEHCGNQVEYQRQWCHG